MEGLDALSVKVNGPDNESSPAKLIGDLEEALHLYSSSPQNRTMAENAVEAARQLVSALNAGAQALQNSRTDADQRIAAEVEELNTLLSDFHTANKEVVQGTQAGRDVSEALDKRDALLKKIAEKLPVSTIDRAGGDMVILTGDGTMLYETTPRTISFEPLSGYSANTSGNAVYVDGVPLEGGSGGNTSAEGRIAALLQLRDAIAPDMQRQLDEIARGLITTFAEKDPLGVDPDLAGLFTWTGGPAIPAAGTLENGLAASISINPAMDFTAGGDPVLLRDGGVNGAAYVWNVTGVASYTDLLIDIGDRLNTTIPFDLTAGLGDAANLNDYAASSISWVEGLRQQSSEAAETKSALMAHTGEALSNATGVNIDEEMSLLLDLEHSYQASTRLLKAVDEMLTTLLSSVN
jgi:flagellar hook-associated protein 1 FlgK